MFIVPLRIAKVLDQQIRTKTWNSLREILLANKKKYLLVKEVAPSMDEPLQVEHEKLWKEKQMLVNEKNHYC